jgi:hypothetical protein
MIDTSRPRQRLSLQLAVLFAPFVAIGAGFVLLGRLMAVLG